MPELEIAGKELVVGDEIAAASIGYGHAAGQRLTVVGITHLGAFMNIETGPGNSHMVPVNRTITVWRPEPVALPDPEQT
ncbi:hypothetical protein ACLKMY_40840 [Paraburkholderia mimosarum]|uniref:hypothetical protein n=1 Tax=Paraburkholderia mimosarum TaxID=312026 RepID=UPI0005AAE65F|nr:hypothetical protein [Paraburkholderia mimosarum]